MPYLQIELDAKKKIPAAARLAGIPHPQLLWGLVELWEWCWTEKSAVVSLEQIEGLFGHDGFLVSRALAAFGFIEKQSDGGFRVKGAARYLRISDARKEAGRKGGVASAEGSKSLANLKQRRSKTEATPKQTDSKTEALTPSTEHRAPSTTAKDLAAKKPPPDERWNPTIEKLEAAFKAVTGQTYRFQGQKDGSALKRLLATQTPEEVLRRWAIGLKWTGWKHTATVAQLDSKWNDLVTPDTPAKGAAWTQPGATDWENRPRSFLEELAGPEAK